MSTTLPNKPSIFDRVRRLGAVTFIFLFFGPPCGSLVSIFVWMISQLVRTDSWLTFGEALTSSKFWPQLSFHLLLLPHYLTSFLAFLMMAGFLFGWSYAAAAGLIIGFRLAFLGPASWIEAAVVGLLMGMVLSVRSFWPFSPLPTRVGSPTFTDFLGMLRPFPPLTQGTEFSYSLFGIAILVCVVPTIFCWAIVKEWHFLKPKFTGTAL